NVTLFMTLLAIFQTLLTFVSEQDDIVVGTPIANRTRPELEGLIGCFVNTLALRTRLELARGQTGRALLAGVRETCLAAYAQQDLPFEQVVELVQPDRSLRHNPLVQVAFVYQNAEQQGLELPGIAVEPLKVVNPVTRVDLTLSLE